MDSRARNIKVKDFKTEVVENAVVSDSWVSYQCDRVKKKLKHCRNSSSSRIELKEMWIKKKRGKKKSRVPFKQAL